MEQSSIAYVVICLVSMVAICIDTTAKAHQNVFNVLSYGAAGNGIADDTLAFVKAWNDTCNAGGGAGSSPTMIVPKGKTFLVQAVKFTGPCKSTSVNVKVRGGVRAPEGPSEWKADWSRWLVFRGVNGLTVDGLGSIDGRGKPWWDRTCKLHPLKGCITRAPSLLAFEKCNNLEMSHLHIYNSPQPHIVVSECQNVKLGFLNVHAPKRSPNTDGIHIQNVRNVSIHSSIIGVGDDCISIGDLTSDVNITDITCGPGHGVSIGSLGKDGSETQVTNIKVRRVNFNGTTNGVRIKTWQTGRGQVRNVAFQNINFTAVKNPIIIDQFYCDQRGSCPKTKTGVHISDVVYSKLQGTSKTAVAINLNCSENVACTGITFNDIQLAPATPGLKLTSKCHNAFGTNTGIIEPKSCLSPNHF